MTSKVIDLNIRKTSFLYLRFGWDLRRMPDRLDGLEEIAAPPPQGINENRRDACRHGDHAPYRIDQSRRGRRNPQTVEKECEGDVLHDLSVTVTADLVGIEHGANPFVEDDHVGGFDRDIGSAVESDADVCLHQRRSIVDAVADHSHARALLKLSDHRTGEMECGPLVIAGRQA